MDDKTFEKQVRLSARGDAHAFGSVYGEIAADAYRFALWYLKKPHDAEDAVQEACLKAWTNIKNLKKPSAFKSWFFKILSNVCKTSLVFRNNMSGEEINENIPAPNDDIQQKTELNCIMEMLSEEDRNIVLLSVIAGFTSKEIAEMTSSKPGTVRSRLSRAMSQLRTLLNAEEKSDE